jgi:hypothetical protein
MDKAKRNKIRFTGELSERALEEVRLPLHQFIFE